MVGIGVPSPRRSTPDGAAARGLSALDKQTPSHGDICFVRRSRRPGRSLVSRGAASARPRGRPAASILGPYFFTGRAPDRQSGGSRFDPDRIPPSPRSPLLHAAQAQAAGPLFGKQETASAILASSSREQRSHADIVQRSRWQVIPPCRCGFDSRCPLRFDMRVVAQRSELEAAKLETGVRLPLTAPRGRTVLARGVAPACAPLCKSDRPGFDPRAPHSVSAVSCGHGPEVGLRASTPPARVRLPLPAPSRIIMSRTSGEERGLQNRGSGFDSRLALREVARRFLASRPLPSMPSGEAAVF